MTDLFELQRALDAIEEEEAKLLIWGDTGGIFAEEEVLTVIEDILPREDPEEILEELEDHAMLFPALDAAGRTQGYRSRMSESVHLYRNLRQWFHGRTIEQTSTLVSDYRFLRRPRQYPARNLMLPDLIEEWSSNARIPDAINESLIKLVDKYQLSGFQARATNRILTGIDRHHRRIKSPSATIICAGTGSGKTMAFYLPALSSIAKDVIEKPKPRVKILAIYPRKELLKDQFNEAWLQCRKLDDIVQNGAGRKLRLGALFGDTPDQAQYALKQNQNYLTYGLLKCATPNCEGEMRWERRDIQSGLEQLQCHLCGHRVLADEVALTRQSMVKTPPDILFTTTEMLNQQMGNPFRRRLFGIGEDEPIPVVLLDEVHTYGGSQGAQTAYLLRRWMRLSRTSPHFVGLSATLADAENYFARLTGTNPSRVRLIEPLKDELTEEGAEYLLALRGDPVSQTALLSTTIQTAMLTRRLQDVRRDKKSAGTWGTKTFVFTDDLDVINRLFYQLADAEGWIQQSGRLIQNPLQGPLAILRNPAANTPTTRQKLIHYGQDWSATKLVGYGLDQNDRATISRTSSQDEGVDNQADIVVATASLEVGFNDTEVGAVIQHKAPRNFSSYLQRKGRAGRTRSMRPWTLIVLSEFGRDRVIYQNYERLLDPEVKLQSLPIGNGHIRRMQAAMATLDWLSIKIEGFNPWLDLNRPRDLGNKQQKLTALISELLEESVLQAELINYLSQALKIDEKELNQVLWQPPRSIFMEFIPTLRRRLETNWSHWSNDKEIVEEWAEENKRWRSPVPEYIPDNLFSDLNLPTVHISLSRGANAVWEGMRFFQALTEYAPGRVSKRYSVQRGNLSDWLVPQDMPVNVSLHNATVEFEVDDAFGVHRTYIDKVEGADNDAQLQIFQPNQMFTSTASRQPNVADTSNAQLVWKSIFREGQYAEKHPIPKSSVWTSNFKSITFYSHRSLTQLEVIRFNVGSNAEIKFRDGQRASVKYRWKHDNEPVGIGAQMWVDAACLEFQLDEHYLEEWLSDDALIRALRSSYFQDQLRGSEVFEGNTFKADWIYECFIAAVSIEAINSQCDIKNAINSVCAAQSDTRLEEIPEILFQQDINITSSNSTNSSDSIGTRDQRLQTELKDMLTDSSVLSVLRELGEILVKPLGSDQDFLIWCREIVGNTLSAALQQTVCTLLPDVDEKEIITDPVLNGDQLQIWLCEQESGGTGVISQFQDSYAEDPVKILNVLAQTISYSDYEQLDQDIYALLAISDEERRLEESLDAVRQATSYHSRVRANNSLKRVLIELGFQYTHSFSAVLYSRILRPGSGVETDRQIRDYLNRWKTSEEQIGYELPMNIIALVLSMERYGDRSSLTVFNEACRIQSLIWPRGNAVRQAVLAYYNRFRGGINRTERLLVACMCKDRTKEIKYKDVDWLANLHDALEKDGKADLLLPRDSIKEINSIIPLLHVRPVDTHGLLFYPRLSSIKRDLTFIKVRTELAETMH